MGFGKSANKVWILLAKVGVAGSNPVSRSFFLPHNLRKYVGFEDFCFLNISRKLVDPSNRGNG